MKPFGDKCLFKIVLLMATLFVVEEINPVWTQGATIPTITLPQKTITIYGLDIGFQNMKMSSFYLIDEPTYKRIGIIQGDSLLFKAVLTPDVPLTYEKFSWSGAHTGTGQMISTNFTYIGLNSERVTVGGKTKTAITAARVVGAQGEAAWCLTNADSCLTAFNDGDEAYIWASGHEMTLGGNIHNGRADAARHSYWNAIMVVDGLSFDTALGASTAYEYSELSTSPHNEVVMDLENDSAGAGIGTSLGTGVDRTTVDTAIRSALSAGTLTILDDFGNSNEVGLLQPSNK